MAFNPEVRWQHQCPFRGVMISLPAGEKCDFCGKEAPQAQARLQPPETIADIRAGQSSRDVRSALETVAALLESTARDRDEVHRNVDAIAREIKQSLDFRFASRAGDGK